MLALGVTFSSRRRITTALGPGPCVPMYIYAQVSKKVVLIGFLGLCAASGP